MEDFELDNLIESKIEEYMKTSAFTDRKVTDTPTDDLQVVNKKYVDARYYGRMYLTGGQSIGAASDTKVALNNTDFSQGVTADLTNNQFTIQTAGIYAIIGQVWYSVGSVGDIHECYLKVNSSYITQGRTVSPTTNANSTLLYDLKNLNSGDTVQLWTQTSNGSGQSLLNGSGIYTYLEIYRI